MVRYDRVHQDTHISEFLCFLEERFKMSVVFLSVKDRITVMCAIQDMIDRATDRGAGHAGHE